MDFYIIDYQAFKPTFGFFLMKRHLQNHYERFWRLL